LKKSKLHILPILLLVLAMAGCDSNNNSKAQDMETPEAQLCACFTEDDIVKELNNMGLVSCLVSSLGFEFLDDENETLFGVQCDSNASNCSCSNMSDSQMLQELQADICLMVMFTSILKFEGVETVGCVFSPVE